MAAEGVTVDVRPVAEPDLAGVHAVAAAVGQGYEGAGGDPRYVRYLAGVGRFLVAVDAGRVVGYAASRRIGDVDMLCDLFVAPDRHGHGVGRVLLDAAWSGARRRMTFSSSHPAAVPLYVRAGMVPAWSLFYLYGEPSAVPARPGASVVPVPADDAAAVERELTGLDRTEDHRYWRSRPEGGSFVVSTPDGARAVGVVGGGGDEFGVSHLVADRESAEPVLAVLAGLRRPALVRLPGPHPALPVLLAAGWRIGYVDLFMASESGLLPETRVAPHPGLA